MKLVCLVNTEKSIDSLRVPINSPESKLSNQLAGSQLACVINGQSLRRLIRIKQSLFNLILSRFSNRPNRRIFKLFYLYFQFLIVQINRATYLTDDKIKLKKSLDSRKKNFFQRISQRITRSLSQ